MPAREFPSFSDGQACSTAAVRLSSCWSAQFARSLGVSTPLLLGLYYLKWDRGLEKLLINRFLLSSKGYSRIPYRNTQFSIDKDAMGEAVFLDGETDLVNFV